jgi:serine protease AprX
MEKNGPTTRGNPQKRPDESDLLVANVILRSATGKSPGSVAITPQTVREYLPDQKTLQEARRLLTEAGFEVRLVAPTHIAIAGRKELFEHTFHVRLEQKSAPLLPSSMGRDKHRATQFYYVTDVSPTIPPTLAPVVERVEFPGPVTYFVSATPPPLSFYHLRVPDDVAAGMDAVKAHELNFTGEGIHLAMVDSGFMTPFHPYYTSQGYDIQPVVPEEYTADSDWIGHGTGIAACALAVAPGVTFTPYQIKFDPAAAFANAAMDAPDIITCSWGTNFSLALQYAINHAVANGIVVCFACGNAGVVGWPATEPAVIAIGGAYIADDETIEASDYASSGVTHSGRQVPDLCGIVGKAPHGVLIALPTEPGSELDIAFACEIGSPFNEYFACDIVDGTATDDGWVVASGTSSAAPMVAGTAALIMQGNPAIRGNPEAVRLALMQSCKDVTSGASANGHVAGPGVDAATGAGLVQAYEAVKDYPLPLTIVEAAVDPLAILLGAELYAKLKKPNPPPLATLEARIREIAHPVSSKKKQQVLARVKAVDKYAKIVVRALSENA